MNNFADIFVVVIVIFLFAIIIAPSSINIYDMEGVHTVNVYNISPDIFVNLKGEYFTVNTMKYTMTPEFLNMADQAGWELTAAYSKAMLTLNFNDYVFHRKSGSEISG